MQGGILDKSRLVANVLMVILVVMNIWFTVQYTQSINKENVAAEEEAIKIETRLENAQFMKLFVDSVLGTNGVISFEDRVRLENDVRALGDADLLNAWEIFVESEDSETAQKNAVRLMSLLSNKMVL